MHETSQQSAASVARRGNWLEPLTVAGFCAFLFYFGLGSFGLVGADEPRYAQIAREMLARHDWITPVLNGAAWLEKPVLYYWGAMLSYRIFGVSDWAARVPSAVLATAIVGAIYAFMQSFPGAKAGHDGEPARPGSPLDGALIAASSAAIIGFGRAASTDMPLAATFTIGMLAWYAWFAKSRRRWLAAFYVCMGLSILAKGPVAPFLAAVIIVIFAAARREYRLVVRTLWSPALVLFFVVAAPWYAAVQVHNPEFFRTFFLEHNLARFAQDVFHHRQPFWYYVPVLLLMLVPWTVLGIAALGSIGRPRVEGETPATDGEAPALRLFLLIWLLVPVVFFSFSQSKLPGYILPAVPAFTLLIADHLRRTRDVKPNFALVILHAALGALLLGAILLTQYFLLHIPAPRQALVVAGVVAAAIFIGMALTLRLGGVRLLRFVTLVPVVLGLAFVIRVDAPTLDMVYSARPIARELERISPISLPVAVFQAKREVEYGLNFYRNQPISRYERGEIPTASHLLVAPEGRQGQIQAMVPDRRVSRIGDFGLPRELNPSAVHLEFYWVSAPGGAHQHHPGV